MPRSSSPSLVALGLLLGALVFAPSKVASERSVSARKEPARRASGRPQVQPAATRPASGPPAPSRPDLPEPYPVDRTLSPLTPRVVAHLRALRAAHPDRDERVFAKVGDSITATRAYLTCFGTDEVDLGDHERLRAGLEWFRGGRIGRTDPYRRASEAARVGWSSHQVLGGPLRRELARTDARFATVMLGTNEVDSDAPRRFARRMWQIVDTLLERGVIPILSTVPGRADDREADRLVPLYNQLVRGIAQGRAVPLLDIGRELERLDGRGLARDGVHPNVYVRRGRGRPCELTDDGLAHGHNVRNLRTLQMLDRVRRTVIAGEAALDPPGSPHLGKGSGADPVSLTTLPFTLMRPWPDAETERHHRVELGAAVTLSVAAFSRRGERLDLEVRDDEGRAIAARRSRLQVRLPPGGWDLVVTDPGGRPGDEYLLVTVPKTPPNPFR